MLHTFFFPLVFVVIIAFNLQIQKHIMSFVFVFIVIFLKRNYTFIFINNLRWCYLIGKTHVGCATFTKRETVVPTCLQRKTSFIKIVECFCFLYFCFFFFFRNLYFCFKSTSGMHRCYNKSFGSNSMDYTILSHIYEFHVCKFCVRLIFM